MLVTANTSIPGEDWKMQIAVVGGGAAAISVLVALARGNPEEVTVVSDQPPGPGRAYAEPSSSALLNR